MIVAGTPMSHGAGMNIKHLRIPRGIVLKVFNARSFFEVFKCKTFLRFSAVDLFSNNFDIAPLQGASLSQWVSEELIINYLYD